MLKEHKNIYVYMLMDDYLCVYILMGDYIVYICVYVLMGDYIIFLLYIYFHDTFFSVKNS